MQLGRFSPDARLIFIKLKRGLSQIYDLNAGDKEK
jgi:hypothetical protein